MAEMERICNAGAEVIGGENNADDAIIEAEELQCDELSEVSTPEEMETWLNATISGRWMGSALNIWQRLLMCHLWENFWKPRVF